MGEHLVEASGKLCLLDSMLAHLQEGLVPPLVVLAPPAGDWRLMSWFFVSLFLFSFSCLVFLIAGPAGEEVTGSCCSPRWLGCWISFRITWNTEVKSHCIITYFDTQMVQFFQHVWCKSYSFCHERTTCRFCKRASFWSWSYLKTLVKQRWRHIYFFSTEDR